MPAATMTSKGQITVPAEVREALGLRSGSRVNFVRTDSGVYELVPETRSVTSLKGVLSGAGRAVSLDEMDDAIREGAIAAVER